MVAVRLGARGDYDWRDTFTSLTMGFGSTLASVVFGGTIVAAYAATARWHLFAIPVTWWSGALCFVLDDLAYYAFHRSAHRVRWFWASHVVHHSSQHYNLTTALRQTWTGFWSLSFAFRLPLLLLGFDVRLVLFVAGVNLVYQFWVHTEAVRRLPFGLEYVLNTPSHHRVHHGSNPAYLDRNYGGVLIVWDRLFGTFEPEVEPVRYGLVHNIASFKPGRDGDARVGGDRSRPPRRADVARTVDDRRRAAGVARGQHSGCDPRGLGSKGATSGMTPAPFPTAGKDQSGFLNRYANWSVCPRMLGSNTIFEWSSAGFASTVLSPSSTKPAAVTSALTTAGSMRWRVLVTSADAPATAAWSMMT